MGEKPLVEYQTDNEKVAIFTIKSQDQSGEEVNLHLSQKTNGMINVALGAGSINVDLSNLDIPVLNASAGAGVVDVTFSKSTSTVANLAAGVGKLHLSIYKDTGVKINLAPSYSNINLADAYEKVGDGYQTKNYSQAKVKVDLNLGQALGGFVIDSLE